MDINEMMQKLLAAELAKLEQKPEGDQAVKAFDAEAFAASLSEKLGEVVEKAVDAKVQSLKSSLEKPRSEIAVKSLDNDPVAFLAEKAERGEQFNDNEKRVAWAMTEAVLREGLR